MGAFDYQAVDGTGNKVSGRIEAADRRGAIYALYERGYYVSSLSASTVVEKPGRSGDFQAGIKASPVSVVASARTEAPPLAVKSSVESGGITSESVHLVRWFRERVGPSFFGGRVREKNVLSIMSQLSTALRAGLPLMNALQIINQQQSQPRLRELLAGLTGAVNSGRSLSESMGDYPAVFGPLPRAMIRVGETGGILDQTSDELVKLMRRDDQIKTKIKNASAYPLFVLTIGLASVLVVVVLILPRLLASLTGGAVILPWPTRVLLGVSGFLKSYGWLLLIGAAVLAGVFTKWRRSEAGRLVWDRIKLRVPVFGTVLRTIAVGRFARTLGALSRGGVPILESLTVVRDTLGNEVLARHIDEAAEQVRVGTSLSEALKTSGDFPPLLVQIVGMGEQTGRLDEMLHSAAETFEADADAAIARFMAILPGVLILLLAMVIGFIVAATLLPIIVIELGAAGA